MVRPSWFLPTCLLLAVAAPVHAVDFPDLLKRLPEQANAVLVMDVQDIALSPLGKKEDLGKGTRSHYLGGVSNVPSFVNKMVIGAQLNPGTLEPNWRVGVVFLNKDVTLGDIVRNEGGSADEIADIPVVLTSRNSYVSLFDSRIVGVRTPANRQDTGRWLRAAKQSRTSALSPYLQEAITGVGRGTEVVLAVDLEDVFDLEGVRHSLRTIKDLPQKGVDIEALAKGISKLRGIRVRLKINQEITGEIFLDFPQAMRVSAPAAKSLLLTALDAAGAHLDDLQDWQAVSEGKSLVFRGKLSSGGARQLLSPLLSPASVPVAPSQASSGTTPVTPAPTVPTAEASLRYFRSVTTLLNDIRDSKAKTFTQLAQWYQKAARAIDELPLLGVDPEVIKYGQSISTTLKSMASVAYETQTQNKIIGGSATVVTGTVPASGYAYGGWGGYGWGYSPPQRYVAHNMNLVNNLVARTTGNEHQMRLETWKNIDEATNALRVQMTSKYMIEFR